MTPISKLLLLVSLVAAQQSASARPGTIVGRLRDVGGDSLANIRIAAIPADDDPAAGVLSNLTQTDADGGYRLEDVAPGRYLIIAGGLQAPTYFPGVISRNQGIIVTVAAGQVLTNLDFTLTSISVEALLPQCVTASARVDDGSRVPGPPYSGATQIAINGESIDVLAGSCRTFNQLRAGPNVVTAAAVPHGYYVKSIRSGSLDLTSNPLVVKPNLPAPGIEVVLTRTRPAELPSGVKVSGRLTNVEVPNDSVYPLGLTGVLAAPAGFPARVSRTEVPLKGGAFVIDGLLPGRYTLKAFETAYTFDVGKSDIVDMELKYVKYEAPPKPSPAVIDSFKPISGTVQSPEGTAPAFEVTFTTTRGETTTYSLVVTSKEFSVRLPEGEYRLGISNLPPGVALDTVTSGALDLTAPFLVTQTGIVDRYTTLPKRGSRIPVPIGGGITVRLKAAPR